VEIHSYLIEAAAQLIVASLETLPVSEEAKWRGYDATDTELLHDLIDQVTWSDLLLAVRSAADRLEARGNAR
jgi:hypothetical protein